MIPGYVSQYLRQVRVGSQDAACHENHPTFILEAALGAGFAGR
jgi:hypothetical protein